MTDLVETAASAGTFKTLLTLVEAAGLLDILKSPGPFAVIDGVLMPALVGGR